MSRPSKPGETPKPWSWMFRPAVVWLLTYRERVILATVIQWLGSNVGWCFLTQALKRCGYDVVARKEEPEVKPLEIAMPPLRGAKHAPEPRP